MGELKKNKRYYVARQLKKNINCLIDRDLHAELKAATAKNNTNMTEIVIRAVKEYLKNEKVPNNTV